MRTTTMAGAAALTLALSACSLLPGSGSDGLTSGDDYSVTGALAEVPLVTGDDISVATADLVRATEINGVDRPATFDPKAIFVWEASLDGRPFSGTGDDRDYGTVHAAPPQVGRNSLGSKHTEFEELAGWTTLDVDSYVEVRAPHDVTVLTGAFDDDTLADLPEVEPGVRTIGEGPDRKQDLEKVTPVSPVGWPMRTSVEDGNLAISPSTETVQSWREGPDSSMADHPALGPIATALDEEDVVSARLEAGDFRSAGLQGSEAEPLADHPFDGVGVGWGAQDGEPRVVVSYHFADDDAASAAVEPLREVFDAPTVAEDLVIEEISADGSLVTARLSTVKANSQHSVPARLQRRDAPFYLPAR